MLNRDISKNISIASSQYAREEDYWLKKLSGELTGSYFPYDFPNRDHSEDTRLPACFRSC